MDEFAKFANYSVAPFLFWSRNNSSEIKLEVGKRVRIGKKHGSETNLKFIKIIVHRNSIIRERYHKTKNKNYKIYHSIFITLYSLKGLYF